jgi:hypothetical protein
LLLRKELDERLAAAGVTAEWADIVRDLDRVEQYTVEQGTKRYALRPEAPGCAGSLFAAVATAVAEQHTVAQRASHATSEAPRPTAAWCHVAVNFPDSTCNPITSGFRLSNFS